MLTAWSVAERSGRVWQWVVKACPFCGKQHWHGGGPASGDPRERLGPRVAHCGQGDYELRDEAQR